VPFLRSDEDEDLAEMAREWSEDVGEDDDLD